MPARSDPERVKRALAELALPLEYRTEANIQKVLEGVNIQLGDGHSTLKGLSDRMADTPNLTEAFNKAVLARFGKVKVDLSTIKSVAEKDPLFNGSYEPTCRMTMP